MEGLSGKGRGLVCCHSGCGWRGRLHGVGSDRLLNVLYRLEAKIGKGERQDFADVAVGSLRDADASWIGQCPPGERRC